MTAHHSVQAGTNAAAVTVDVCCVSAVSGVTPALLQCLSLSRRSLSRLPVTQTVVSLRTVGIFRQEKAEVGERYDPG